jgi:hypothetical protein
MPACTVTWTNPDVGWTPQDHRHQCVFNTAGPHTRHECGCGWFIVTEASR